MSRRADKLVKWSARLLAIVVAIFIGSFALDALDEGLIPLLLHAIPALILLSVAALAWRWEWIGAAGFIALAAVYAGMAGRWDWILVISGPLAVTGLLYLLSWRGRLTGSRL